MSSIGWVNARTFEDNDSIGWVNARTFEDNEATIGWVSARTFEDNEASIGWVNARTFEDNEATELLQKLTTVREFVRLRFVGALVRGGPFSLPQETLVVLAAM